jgi:hypothetical protein
MLPQWRLTKDHDHRKSMGEVSRLVGYWERGRSTGPEAQAVFSKQQQVKEVLLWPF